MFGLNKIIPIDTNYPFMDYRKIFIIISFILISINSSRFEKILIFLESTFKTTAGTLLFIS